jgi:hypothetical protein
MKDGVYVNGHLQDYVLENNGIFKLHDYVTYPRDYKFQTFSVIKDKRIADRILEIHEIKMVNCGRPGWLNKLGVVIEVRDNAVFMICKHDFSYYIMKKSL